MTMAVAPAPVPDLRLGLQRLSRGLIAYGIVGLIVAAIGLGALVWANGRIGTLSDRVGTTVDSLATTVDNTATALNDASATAESFTTTIDTSVAALTSVADTIGTVRDDLRNLESQLRSVSILGSSPLNGPANTVGNIATSLESLDGRLSAIGESLATNRDSLARNAVSLGALGDSTAALAIRLRSGSVEDSLDDVAVVITVMLLVFTAWAAVPAVGALAFGIWLRRELERAGPLRDVPP
jgi:hypothetical protein